MPRTMKTGKEHRQGEPVSIMLHHAQFRIRFRSTAKKFLAAANFLEVLEIFPRSEVSESVRPSSLILRPFTDIELRTTRKSAMRNGRQQRSPNHFAKVRNR